MWRYYYVFLTFLLFVFGEGDLRADSPADFTFASKWSSNIKTVAPITVSFGGSTSDQTGYRRFKNSATMSVSAETGYNITGITVTFTTTNGKSLPVTGKITSSPGELSFNGATCSWSGTANSVVLTKDATGEEYDIVGVSVSYSASAQTEWSYVIPIEDLRFEHLTYDPSRTGIYGLGITTNGWQSYTNTNATPHSHTLLLSAAKKSDNSFTITSSSANITKVVLVGAFGVGTFANSTPTGSNNYATTDQDQIVWMNANGNTTATISITATDQPQVSAIYVFTNSALSEAKQDVTLSFDPASGSADAGITDYQIDGRVKASVAGTNVGFFRPDEFSVTNSGSNASYNQFHISTGKVGVNTGSTAGSATITATFAGNQFYNPATAATAGSYELTISSSATQTKTITVNDMRISKTASSEGLNATSGLNRTLGGFNFAFTGGDGVKFNNGDFLILRNNGTPGVITITPQTTSGTVIIDKVVINTISGYTTGTVTATGSSGNISLSDESSYTFDNVNTSSFVMTSVSGDVYVQSFTIYYTESVDGALNDAIVTPTIIFSRPSDTVNSGETLTSPTITTNPANYDISLSSSNTGVATVKTSNWLSAPLVSLQGETGTATITASAAASTYFNAAVDATYTVTYVDAAAQKWDFRTLNVASTITNDKGWNGETGWSKSGDYYQNLFTTSNNSDVSAYSPASPSQLEGLKFGRVNSNGLGTEKIRLYSSYMQFRNSAIWVDVPVTAAGDKVIVTFDGGNGTTQAGFDITNATVEGDATATSILSDETQTTVTLIATAADFVRLQVTKSNVKLYRIQVSTETRATLNLRDTSNSYEKNVGTGTTASTNNHFSHRVMFTPSDGAADPVTYADDASRFHITSSDPSVLDVSNVYVVESSFGRSSSFYFANVIPKSAGTATLTITFDGNNDYKPNSYVSQTYTVYGPGSFLVSANDQEIQQGQLSTIVPIITDKNGNPIGIKEMTDGSGRYTTYILGEDEDIPDYTDFFDFTYTAGSGSGTDYVKITVDEYGQIKTGADGVEAAVGTTRMITVSATPKGAYSSAFSSTEAVTEELTVTIIEKTADVQVEFYWDAACSAKITMADPSASVTGDDNTYADKVWTFNSGKFSDGFPNGRILYVKPKNEGDAIWFSYAQDANAAVIPANPTLDRKNHVYQYRRGIPIYIDETLSGSNYVNVNVVATTYDASTKKYTLRGTVARLMFPKIVAHERPAEPTYDPISPDAEASLNKDGRKMMNTSENVVAYGEGASKTNPVGAGNLVYGKFSTGTVYTTEQLINENAVQKGTGSVPVVSTEVAKRRFTAVQVKHYNNSDTYGEADYISEQTYTEYWYLFDTDLRLYSNAEKTTPLQRLEIATGATTATPYYKVTWYNKRNYDDPGNYSLGVTQEVDSYDGKISYTIMSRSGASDATIDSSTGAVTAGNNPGWVRVKATYAGGEEHGGKSGEPQYKSTTDKSEAYFYVYIADPATHKPIITPQTCNYAGTMTYKVLAPNEWNVRYTTNGTDPTPNNGTEISANGSVENTIGEGLAVGTSITVKAIAYNSDGSVTSAIVSETYTKKDAIPDPIFDPNGVGTAYRYNTSTLTVQIACARAGANIYYTIDGTDPVIGNVNTYKYSGLSKVVISGNVAIKAIAYDPVEDMYSNVVTSNYVYSDVMDKPYYQISNDEGATWWGFNSSGTFEQNATAWNNGQSRDVTPSTLIRIIDPNPVKGTIFYTVDGTTPADNATSMVYAEGYPFTVAKTSTGKAITILEDASSDVSTANFTIDTRYGHVWEAVAQTTPDGKMLADDGFVISTNSSLSAANSGTNVNTNSLASGGKGFITYAQADITATFGGFDLKDWGPLNIADAATGSPLDAVGEFSIKGVDNAKMEAKNETLTTPSDNYNHINSYVPTTVHEKTFKIPSQGSYVRFEPEKDGDLTIWVLQQGAVHYEEDKYFIDRYIRMKPVYMVDEQGKSYQVKTINGVPQLWSSARLSTNWTRLQAIAAENGGVGGWANYDRDGEGGKKVGDYIYLNKTTGEVTTSKPADFETGNYKEMENKGPNREESQTLYNLYKAYLDKNHVSVGDPIKPFAIHTGTAISQNNGNYSDNSNDGTGYVLVSGGYAKYTFEVKAGKSYYFFATGSKIGVRGFQFVPTETGSRTTVTVDSASTTAPAVADTPVDVTLNRTFSAGTWTSLVLPFSVSTTQLEQVFGDAGIAPEVIHFDKVTQSGVHWRLVLMKHYHQMIVAGTPVLIKPAKSVYHPTFHGVHIETSEVESMTQGDYTMMGSLVKTADNAGVKTGDYFMSTSGTIKRWTGADHYMPGTYAWLHPTTAEAAGRVLSFTYEDVVDGTTGIVEVEQGTAAAENIADGTVYDLRGIKVSDNSLKGLPKGVYIVNSKKIIVK
jgi:hypothetical protein